MEPSLFTEEMGAVLRRRMAIWGRIAARAEERPPFDCQVFPNCF